MSDEPKKASDRFASWKKTGAAKVSSAGGSKDILQKALALNPNLKGDQNTAEFLADAAAAQKEHAEKKIEKAEVAARAAEPAKPSRGLVQPVAPPPKNTTTDFANILEATKAWLQAETARVDQDLAETQRELAAAPGRKTASAEAVRNELLDVLIKVDPNLLSPKTKGLLEEEAKFLKIIGFAPDQIKQRMRKR